MYYKLDFKMIIWLLFLLCPFSLHGIIIKGYELTSPSGAKVSALGDLHPSPEDMPPQDKERNQVEVCREFARQQSEQSREKTVFLVEEISPSIVKTISPHLNFVLKDVPQVAKSTGLGYENIDLRAATHAAYYVFDKHQRKEKISKKILLGSSSCEMSPSLVTLDDLFKEKERYIDTMKQQFSWGEQEQEKADKLHSVLYDRLQGSDLSMTIHEFCKQKSDEACERVCDAMDNLSFYLFDKYGKKLVFDYAENRRYRVLLAAGFVHVTNIQDQLEREHGWSYYVRFNGGGLSGYELKSTLGITTWWDYTKSIFGCI